MKIGQTCFLVALAGMALGCASTSPVGAALRSESIGSPAAYRSAEDKERRAPRVDISVFTGKRDLDAVEFDLNDSAFSDTDLEVERQRAGARFAFGGSKSRGFFEVFAETLDGEFFGTAFNEYDAFGLGGGVIGVPRVNDSTSALAYLIPYSGRLAIVAGSESVPGTSDDSVLAYLELHLEVGFGVEWMGIRPSLGVQASSFAGALVTDGDSSGDGDDDEFELSGFNLGTFVELYYKHPDFPIYGRLRGSGGDYDIAEFSIGVAW